MRGVGRSERCRTATRSRSSRATERRLAMKGAATKVESLPLQIPIWKKKLPLLRIAPHKIIPKLEVL